MRLLFDVEANGLLQEATVIHSLVIRDLDTDDVWSCCEDNIVNTISYGISLLNVADELWAHNGISYDYPVLKKLCPGFNPMGLLRDSLRCTRVMWPDLTDADHRLVKKNRLPAQYINSHSLKAWGFRLGVLKGDFGDTEDFTVWTPKMQAYCEQDVVVLNALVQLIKSKGDGWSECIQLEHDFATVIEEMCQHGIAFNEQAAQELYATLVGKREELKSKLKVAFPPRRVEWETPKKKQKRSKLVEFNPGSRRMIAERLMELGWEPTKHTETGIPQVDEAVLEGLPYPEAKLLSEFFLIQKRVGQVAEGNNAWLKLCRNGRIHGSVNTNGAVTGRCTHSYPNLAQVPRVGSPYGEESRALFGADDGSVLVGADASGLELRCLAHYLARWDGGEYARIVCEGDVHTSNQAAFGLPPGKDNRQRAKNGIYALIYGAGDWKLGVTLWPELEAPGKEQEAASAGRAAKIAFKRANPAYAKLAAAVEEAVAVRGHLCGLDGRHLPIRSKHAALNTLFQSAGALLVKKATVIATPTWRDLRVQLLLHIHDEVQLQSPVDNAKAAGEAFVTSLQEAGRIWKFRCPLNGEFKIGKTWRDTH